MQNKILEKEHLLRINREINFSVGDIVKVHYKIIEGVDKNRKERVQVYEGTVISIQNEGLGKSMVVRRISYDVGVERVFPIYSPTIAKIEKVKSNYIRRAKLYYLRNKSGKQARLKELKKTPQKDILFKKSQELLSSSNSQEDPKSENTSNKDSQNTETNISK